MENKALNVRCFAKMLQGQEGWYQLIEDAATADAIPDRLACDAYRVEMEDESARNQSIHYQVKSTMPACAEHGRQARAKVLDEVGSFTGTSRDFHWNMQDVRIGGGVDMRIEIDKDKVAEFCRRHRIRKLLFFGSVLRDDFGPDSDVDVLVEFEPGARVGLIALAGMENELSDLLGRKVDLNTAGCLSRYFRDEVLREAEVVHEQT